MQIWEKIQTFVEQDTLGMEHIAALLNVVEDSRDLWLVYEVGAASMGDLLFNVKGEFYKGERIYNV